MELLGYRNVSIGEIFGATSVKLGRIWDLGGIVLRYISENLGAIKVMLVASVVTSLG